MYDFAPAPVFASFDFGLIIVPRFVTKPERDLISQRQHLIQHRCVRVLRE